MNSPWFPGVGQGAVHRDEITDELVEGMPLLTLLHPAALPFTQPCRVHHYTLTPFTWANNIFTFNSSI